jgi:hypothetical protein
MFLVSKVGASLPLGNSVLKVGMTWVKSKSQNNVKPLRALSELRIKRTGGHQLHSNRKDTGNCPE